MGTKTETTIIEFNKLPSDMQLRFGKQKSQDTQAVFISISPCDTLRQNGAIVKEMIESMKGSNLKIPR